MSETKKYVEKQDFYDELCKYIEESKINPKAQMSNALGKMIYDTVEGFAKKYCFRDYTFKEDMIGLALLYTIKYIKGFDPKKYDNPHAYVTKIAKNAFLQTIEKEKTNLYVKYKKQLNDHSVLNSIGDSSEIQTSGVGEYSRMTEFIQNFENSKKFKKLKK